MSIATLTRDGDIEALAMDAASHGVQRIFAVMNDVDSAPLLAAIAAHVARGNLQLPPLQRFELSEVAAAHRLLESGGLHGKIALRVAGDPGSG